MPQVFGSLIAGLLTSQLSIGVEAGASLPVSTPQRSLFGVGGAARAALHYHLMPVLEAGATIGYAVQPQATASGPGSVLDFGAGVRLGRSLEGTQVAPRVSADLLYVRSGADDRLGLTLALSLPVRFTVEQSWWLAPFVRLVQIFKLTEVAGRESFAGTLVVAGVEVQLASAGASPPPPPAPSIAQAPAPPPVPPAPAPLPPAPAQVDRDGDGLVDGEDDCARTPGPVENGGCPLYQQVVVTTQKIEIKQKIFFAFGKAAILPKSHGLLAEVAQALIDHDRLCVRIEGHTDAVGGDSPNLVLSRNRAASVREYLLGLGLEDARLSSQGYGPQQPLETNTTSEGRERNRRVEFVIVQCGGAS